MQDIFKTTAVKVQNSYWVIWLFAAVMAMLCSGLYYFFEDTYSSYVGIQQVQTAFNVKIVTFPIGLYLLAITPQIGQIVFGYIAATSKRKVMPMLAILSFVLIDVAFDVWYRSNEKLLENIETAIVSFLITAIVYTLFSEVFITLGGGLALELFPNFVTQLKRFRSSMSRATNSYKVPQQQYKNKRQSKINHSRSRGVKA